MWKCLECGRKFRTTKAAEKAASDGCPNCGGVDIDVDVDRRCPECGGDGGMDCRCEAGSAAISCPGMEARRCAEDETQGVDVEDQR